MVPTPAPRVRRDQTSEETPSRTESTGLIFVKPARSHTPRRTLVLASLTACALCSAGFWSRSNAEAPPAVSTLPGTPADVAPGTPAALPVPVDAAPAANAPAVQVPLVIATPVAPIAVAPVVPLSIVPPRFVAPRSFAFRVYADGRVRSLNLALPEGASVAQALSAAHIVVKPLDRVWPPMASRLHEGVMLHIVRVSAPLRVRYQSIAPQTRYKPTPNIRRGTSQTLQAARPGVIATTERVWFRDGKMTGVEFVSRRVTRRVQNQIIALGTKPSYMPGRMRYHRRYARAYAAQSPRAFRGGSPRDRMGITSAAPNWNYQGTLAPANPGTFKAVKMLTMVATGYASGPAGGAIGNTTATGLPCGYGAVAVDPRVIPLGSKLYIEGYGYGFACDTGGAIKGNRVDLAFDSVRAAFGQGRRTVKVWILQ